jgi:D-alanine---D-serine ligase
MKRTNVVILFGGCSNEYEVSLKSASAVIDHLDRDLYNIIMVGITREGAWLRYDGSTANIRVDRWHMHASCCPAFFTPSRGISGLMELKNMEYHMTPVDVVFPMLHGKNGEDGTVQGLLELSGIPYVGCDMLSSVICMDKAIAHTIVEAAGITTARSITIFEGDHLDHAVIATEQLGYPLYVKPAKSGSSIGITKASSKQELIKGIQLAFKHDKKVVIEQNIVGFEVGCAVLGGTSPIVGEVDEIELRGDFFDFDEKYSLHSSTIHLPARIDANTACRIKETALNIYRTLGCNGLARVDMFLTADGSIVFNEVNTMPGFTAQSRYPNMMSSVGIPFPELLDRLIQHAVSEVMVNEAAHSATVYTA